VSVTQFAVGALAGGVTSYAVSYVIWDVMFGSFFAANMGTAIGVPRETQILWALVVGHLATGALLTLAIATRPRPATVSDGVRIGAIVAFLMWLSVDFTYYGVMNVWNLRATIVDPALEFVHGGISGAAIAAVLGMLRGARPE
jgi:hypothetical protein